MLQRSLLASVVLLGGLHGNAAQSLGPWRIGQGRVMKNPFSPGCNLEHLRTTWMQETKLTAAFKGEERGGFRSRVLQSVSRSFPRAGLWSQHFPPHCAGPSPRPRQTHFFRTLGTYPPTAASSF